MTSAALWAARSRHAEAVSGMISQSDGYGAAIRACNSGLTVSGTGTTLAGMERGVTAEGVSAALPVWLRRVGSKVVKEATMNRRRETPTSIPDGMWENPSWSAPLFPPFRSICLRYAVAAKKAALRWIGSRRVPRHREPWKYLRLEGRLKVKHKCRPRNTSGFP